MELWSGDRLNPRAFEPSLRQATHDLAEVLVAATESGCGTVETTHFLMVLGNSPRGAARRLLSRRKLTPEVWRSGLAASAETTDGALPPAHLTRDVMHPSALAMLAEVTALCQAHQAPLVTETILMLAALRHLTPAVQSLLAEVEIDLPDWLSALETELAPREALALWAPDGSGEANLAACSKGARRVLRLLRSEAEAVGARQADPRHLLLALLTFEGGAMGTGLLRQGLLPRKLREVLALALGRGDRPTTLPLDRAHLQPMLLRLLLNAAELASNDRQSTVAEVHLLRSLLGTENTARRQLELEQVDLERLAQSAESFDPAEEDAPDDDVMRDIDEIRAALHAKLVGQDEAIERVLPFIQRLRFDFRSPGRPVGVFLFCGQSGSGKTELAKELARAVYGSDEQLIFLEMGQFNGPESINILVGAPPGYVGWGQGKLTNGLRDHPRAVVLFDEVEKADSPAVYDALMRFLDEGLIDDPGGPVRDGTSCLVILTSNVGQEDLAQRARREGKEAKHSEEAADAESESLLDLLRAKFRAANFRAEFLNRVDEVILFKTLTAADYTIIAERSLQRVLARLSAEKGVEVVADAATPGVIGQCCDELDQGARPVQRLCLNWVVTPVIDYVLSHPAAAGPFHVKLEPTGRRDATQRYRGVVTTEDLRGGNRG